MTLTSKTLLTLCSKSLTAVDCQLEGFWTGQRMNTSTARHRQSNGVVFPTVVASTQQTFLLVSSTSCVATEFNLNQFHRRRRKSGLQVALKSFASGLSAIFTSSLELL